MTPGVYLTVDVECSMGGAWGDPSRHPVPPSRAIWGQFGGQKLGIPMIVEILRQHGLAGTFFVEPFVDEQGYPGQMQGVCEYLLDAGQDVQLHIHPNHLHYGRKQAGQDAPFTDAIADLPPEAQREMIAEGASRLARWTGRRPVAFRAGNMGASEQTLECLSAVGIPIDSSYCFVFAGGQCRFPAAEPYNGSKLYGDVLELALSGMHQLRLPGLRPAKVLDPVGVSFGECREIIRRLHARGVDAAAILHSFSLMKVRNVQYEGGRPNRLVTGRFRRLCRWLGDSADIHPTRTFSWLAEELAAGRYEPKAAAPGRLNRPVRAVARKLMQVGNSIYWT